jgi:MFS family permease
LFFVSVIIAGSASADFLFGAMAEERERLATVNPGGGESGGRVAFTYPAFTFYEVARFFIVAALEMQTVAVTWQIFSITHRFLDLGYVGLAQFAPGVLLFLVSGHVTDKVNRLKLMIACLVGFAVCSLLLLISSLRDYQSIGPIYAVIVLLGVVRAFNGPVGRALLPQLVPEKHFQNAVAWHSTIFQAATILGPSLGGIIYGIFGGPSAVYASSLVCASIAAFCTLQVKLQPTVRSREPINLNTVLAGVSYIWNHKIVLGAISLDLFAVLLGGATAMLPAYASGILHTGPWGLGILRSSYGVGAAAMAVLIAHRPLKRRVGVTMLGCVGAFGAFTIVFALSRNLLLSLGALICAGAADMVSVVVRATLVQMQTPDAMRGRVNAVDMVFIGASNELGQFESGLTAHWFGLVPSVVIGGLGTIVVTGLWAWFFPALRNTETLRPEPEEEEDVAVV